MVNILINFPTNIGDTVLCLPALDRISNNYPDGKITAISSVYTEELLLRNSLISEVIIFNKFWRIREKIKFCLSLINKFEIIVDFKNSFLPVILNPKKRTKFFRKFPSNMHAKDRYIDIVKNLAPIELDKKGDFVLKEEEKFFWQSYNLDGSIFVACASRFSLKTYPFKYLEKLLSLLIRDYKVAILGDNDSRTYYKDLLFKEGIINLVGRTRLYDLFYLLKNYAKLVICVDCGILHIASYLDLPIIALFGPTDSDIYGPWSKKNFILKSKNMDIEPELIIDVLEKLQKD